MSIARGKQIRMKSSSELHTQLRTRTYAQCPPRCARLCARPAMKLEKINLNDFGLLLAVCTGLCVNVQSWQLLDQESCKALSL